MQRHAIGLATALLAAMLTGSMLVPVTAVGQVPTSSDEPFMPVPQPPHEDPTLVSLGRQLFYDPILSEDERRSCASCHDLETNGASPNRFDMTPDDKPLATNTPTVFNAVLSFRLDWTGDARTLKQQADRSLRGAAMMRDEPDTIVDRLRHEPSMTRRFKAAFGRAPDWDSVLRAIAAFERTLLTPGSRFDLWLSGDRGALSSEERAGYELFKAIGCVACHQGVGVGGNLYERAGVVNSLGASSQRLYRVPSLRNVATTAPYFHDGSAATLQDAVHKMASEQLGRGLSESDVCLITAFLGTLTGRYRDHQVTAPR